MRRTYNFTPTPVDERPGWLLLLRASARCHWFWKWLPHNRGVDVFSSLRRKNLFTAVQRAFCTQFHMESPSWVSIYAWYKKFEQNGCICIHHRGSLHKVWDKLYYRLDICRVTRGAHIESLWGVYKILSIFLSTGVGVKFLVAPHLFSVSFWKCKVLLCSPCIIRSPYRYLSLTFSDTRPCKKSWLDTVQSRHFIPEVKRLEPLTFICPLFIFWGCSWKQRWICCGL
jgi:hypothetical protein